MMVSPYVWSVGRFVLGYSWKRIASDFTLSEGGPFPLGPAVLTVSAVAAGKLRRLI